MLPEAVSTSLERSAIVMHGLDLYARVKPLSRPGAQRLLLDLEIDVPMPRSGDLVTTLDHVRITDIVGQAAMSREFDGLGALARNVGSCLLDLEGVRHLFIRVMIPPTHPGGAAVDGIELLLSRE